VYVAEGCVHCHSQYVRRDTDDEALWGPHRPLDRAQRPPLVGTRRQGPDLSNAGNRRSALWHRLHLVAPRALSPGSRMPSYAHLFAAGEGRGPALVAYLASLGAGSEQERWAAIGTRERQDEAGATESATEGATEGAELFATHCAVCHGAAGDGDGSLASTLRRPTLDLRHGEWAPEDLPRLTRLVRYGIPGTSMPGHEGLRPAEARVLAQHVMALAADSPAGGGA
jgi:cytochrome c oxidase cbb3-type subunit 2